MRTPCLWDKGPPPHNDSTRDLGFATASVDMIMFDYSVADRVDCVCAGNHG
jgi:hypothetical protein